ncbi:MAG: hypothetical protein MZV70_76535 [Desulfobacterales bacterium]|nr:hypothetical protein [Desulfobacterales bacterium]
MSNLKKFIPALFGIPGSLDFEVGNYVGEYASKAFNTNHKAFNLKHFTYSNESMIELSKMINHQTVIYPYLLPTNLYDDINLDDFQTWVGFMGDPSVGSHLPDKPASDIEEAKKYFIQKNKFTNYEYLNFCSDEDLFPLIDCPNIDPLNITFEEQIDFENRQKKFIASCLIINNIDYAVPFIDKKWLNFSLTLTIIIEKSISLQENSAKFISNSF